MRTQSLRQFANRQIKLDRQGKYLYRKHRAYVIRKMIDDLFVIRQVPPSWQALQSEQVHKLVRYWKKQNVNPVTIMRYMTIIRRFLQMNDCSVANIDNQSLELSRPKARKKIIPPDFWRSLNDPLARVIMGLQTEFGLTFKEAILIKPRIQVRECSIGITRDIAFNSTDRSIPIRTESQKAVLNLFNWLTKQYGNLLQLKSYEEIRIIWRTQLAKHRLSSTKSWRYLYAKQMYSSLLPECGNYKTCLLIRDEMGIKSRNTLWVYLKD
ncbi:integrase [Legionella septentrionalis]|uniref:integrase n=1 Tax=Legionella septentrionalis TaxID=2498109 RepID=UPI000F8D5C08|nr:integrase [Legionella septentrionalis]RUR12663.1 integrase [Legionella septentrionalis]